MNKIYNLLSIASKVDNIKEGDEIKIEADYLLAHDGSMPKIINSLKDKDLNTAQENFKKLHVTIDHFLPAPTIESRDRFLEIKEFSRNNGINLYSQGEGILHQVFAEKFGKKLKDKIIVGVDGHMTTSAGLGALAFSISADEMVDLIINNKYTLVVPKLVSINLYGKKLDDLVSGKDVVFHIISKIGEKNLKGNSIMISGEAIDSLSVSQRMTIGNVLGEIGAKTIYFNEFETDTSNDTYNIDIQEVEQLVVEPMSNEIKAIKDLSESKITQVYIGGCTNGRIEDMKEVVDVLKDKKINKDLTLIVCPASRNVANEMDERGLSQIIRNSGGIIINPGCGACSGIHQGVISKNDVIVTTTPRNTSGRMGDKQGKIYLVSPRTAAKIALNGKIN